MVFSFFVSQINKNNIGKLAPQSKKDYFWALWILMKKCGPILFKFTLSIHDYLWAAFFSFPFWPSVPNFSDIIFLVKSHLYQVQTVPLNYTENLRYVSRRSYNKNLRSTWKELKLKLEQTRWSSHKLQNQKLQIQQVENAICVRAFKWWVKKMYLCSRTIFKMLAKNWGQTAQVRYRSGLGSRCSLNMTTKRYKSKQSTKDYATSNFTTTVTVLEIHNNMWKGFFGLFLRP